MDRFQKEPIEKLILVINLLLFDFKNLSYIKDTISFIIFRLIIAFIFLGTFLTVLSIFLLEFGERVFLESGS